MVRPDGPKTRAIILSVLNDTDLLVSVSDTHLFNVFDSMNCLGADGQLVRGRLPGVICDNCAFGPKGRRALCPAHEEVQESASQYQIEIISGYQPGVIRNLVSFVTKERQSHRQDRDDGYVNRFGALESLSDLNGNLFEAIALFLVKHEGGVIGFGDISESLEESGASVLNLYLQRDHRGRGVGKILLEGMIAYSRDNLGYRSVVLDILEDNEAMVGLLQRSLIDLGIDEDRVTEISYDGIERYIIELS